MAALADRHRADRFGRRLRTAVLLVGTAAAGLLFYMKVHRPATTVTATATPIAYRDFETKRGMRALVYLSDGSRVVLAPQSRLRVPETFGQVTRSVELRGEAIFDVVHDSMHGFSVTAGNAELTDIGTRFDVRAYDSTDVVTVAVASGTVSIAQHPIGTETTKAVPVTRGRKASLRGATISGPVPADMAPYFNWEKDQLSFDRQSLRDVLASLSRWYDLDISVSQPALLDQRVTAEFSTQSPTAMLQALAAAVGATSERHGRHVVLSATQR
jgi:transmembrane sensor